MKRIVTFVLSLIMVLSLCACGSGNSKSLSEQYSADGLVQLAYSDIDIVFTANDFKREHHFYKRNVASNRNSSKPYCSVCWKN